MARSAGHDGIFPTAGGAPRLTGRRAFLKVGGAALALAVVGCEDSGTGPGQGLDGLTLGTGDVAVLNYALLLEQLEAEFYTRVVASPYAGISTDELQVLRDLRDHEVIHRDFLGAALGMDALPPLTIDFPGVDFRSRQSVLGTARTFEDLGVSAYNGAGRLLRDPGLLTLAGKIVSVEARHAAVIREFLMPGTASFAGDDVVGVEAGLDVARTPAEVLALAAPFVEETIDTSGLPTA